MNQIDIKRTPSMKTITIPFEFSMDNCSWFDNLGIRQYTVQIELTDEEAQDLSLPHVREKLEAAVVDECKTISYRYALINEFEENQVIYDNEEKMMEVFAKEGLFDPNGSYGGDDKLANFGIWLEEYFFDLEEEQMVVFIEKYYPYVATRLDEEKLAFRYSIFTQR